MGILTRFRKQKNKELNSIPGFFSPFINDFSGKDIQYSSLSTISKDVFVGGKPIGFDAMFNRNNIMVSTKFFLKENNQCHIYIDVEGNGRRWFYRIEGKITDLLQQKRDNKGNLVSIDENL